MKRPCIICHMMSSLDGRIECAMTEKIDNTDVYYEALERLQFDAVLEGRVCRQRHYALHEPFVPADKTPVGKEVYHIAHHAEHYDIAVDTHGSLRWPDSALDDNLLVITEEQCPCEYHDYLTANGISWIACGKKGIDLQRAIELLADKFGVKRLGVVDGCHINGAFLRAGMTAVFDGIRQTDWSPVLLTLDNVERMGNTVWLRYSVNK